MADPARRHPKDAGGDWFVDTTCIDCDVARQVAPGLILEDEQGLSYFARQPRSPEEIRDAWRAVLACPSGSIGGPGGLKPPNGIYPYEVAPGIFLTGYTPKTRSAPTPTSSPRPRATSWSMRHDSCRRW